MSAFEEEKQRELSVLNDMLETLKTNAEAALHKDVANKSNVFSESVAKYIELKFNITMLEEAFDSELEDHMFIPLAVLSQYIFKETEKIEGLYKTYTADGMTKSELTAEVEKHIGNIIDARLGMLRLGKLDA